MVCWGERHARTAGRRVWAGGCGPRQQWRGTWCTSAATTAFHGPWTPLPARFGSGSRHTAGSGRHPWWPTVSSTWAAPTGTLGRGHGIGPRPVEATDRHLGEIDAGDGPRPCLLRHQRRVPLGGGRGVRRETVEAQGQCLGALGTAGGERHAVRRYERRPHGGAGRRLGRGTVDGGRPAARSSPPRRWPTAYCTSASRTGACRPSGLTW